MINPFKNVPFIDDIETILQHTDKSGCIIYLPVKFQKDSIKIGAQLKAYLASQPAPDPIQPRYA